MPRLKDVFPKSNVATADKGELFLTTHEKSARRNKVERIGINSVLDVPLRPRRVEGRADAIVIDVDRSFDLSAAIRARAEARSLSLLSSLSAIYIHTYK